MIKRMVSLWLVLVMAFALCSCGKAENVEQENNLLVGTWQAEVDIADHLNETAGFDYTVEQFVIRIQLLFKEDGTVTMTYDRDYLDEQQTKMAENLWDVMMQMHGEDLGVEPSEVERILLDSGWDADILRRAMGLDSVVENLKDLEGCWCLEENVLYIDPEAAENADPMEISLENDRLSVTGGKGAKLLLDGVVVEEYINGFLPFIFERI